MHNHVFGRLGRSIAALAVILTLVALQLPSSQAASTTIRIGARGFPEEQIAGYLYSELLSAHGFKVSLDESFGGAESVIFAPLKNKQLDVVPDYLGNGLVDLNQVYKPGTSPKTVYKNVNAAFKKKFKLELLTPAYKFNDQNVFVTTKAKSKKFGLKTLANFASKAKKLRVEVLQTCATRTDCLVGFNQVYHPKGLKKCNSKKNAGCEFKKFSTSVNGTDTGTENPFYGDLRKGLYDVVQGYGTTDAQIAHFKLVRLKDTKSLFPPDQLVPFVGQSVAKAQPKMVTWLDKLSAVLTTSNFSKMNAQDVFGGQLPQNIAHSFLKKHHLI
ncbi:MAG TPA: glycine betaine ABC transporter substrate-binding protein [Chloroflexota bacterium]|nr:glycine betaine ABC transporter substrate-binding protein [Chloroflexota bacterium]